MICPIVRLRFHAVAVPLPHAGADHHLEEVSPTVESNNLTKV